MWNWLKKLVGPKAEPKRARSKGRYKADDKSTADVNEAWVGGEAPEKKIKKKKSKLKKEFR